MILIAYLVVRLHTCTVTQFKSLLQVLMAVIGRVRPGIFRRTPTYIVVAFPVLNHSCPEPSGYGSKSIRF